MQLVINPITVGGSAGVAEGGLPMVSNHGIIYLRLMFYLIQHNRKHDVSEFNLFLRHHDFGICLTAMA